MSAEEMASKPASLPVLQVVSGGQTGVDRAALDAASASGLAVGGWCPCGRIAEDGPIPEAYPLTETPMAASEQRTLWNVRDSDGTLVLTTTARSPGTALTVEAARQLGKPLLVVDPAEDEASGRVRDWIHAHRISRLNVAGPRESEAPGIHASARSFLDRLLSCGPPT